jgi:hypothetical protein
MYQVVIRYNVNGIEQEIVIETVTTMQAASWHVQYHRLQGRIAFYRPILTRAA